MSVSRCLGPALTTLGGQHRSTWKAYIDALPATCPHVDCTVKSGCQQHVAEYFRMQWNLQLFRERRLQGAQAAGAVPHE